jgi:hypothetical protein
MDPIYMEYRIHLDLKQFDVALLRLAAAGDKYFEEALTLIKKHRLYKLALESPFGQIPELNMKITLSFGHYLEERGYAEEAGFLFQASGEVEKGLNAFKKSLNVEMCLALAYSSKFTKQ